MAATCSAARSVIYTCSFERSGSSFAETVNAERMPSDCCSIQTPGKRSQIALAFGFASLTTFYRRSGGTMANFRSVMQDAKTVSSERGEARFCRP